MFNGRRAPHIRGRIGGDAAAAVVARLNAATAATMGQPQASPTHHPKTGLYMTPAPPVVHMSSPLMRMETRMHSGDTTSVAEAVKREAATSRMYDSMPFRGDMRTAATRGL